MRSPVLISAKPLDFVDMPTNGEFAARPPLALQCWGLTKCADHPRPHRCVFYVRGGVSGQFLTCFRHRHREAAAQRLKARLERVAEAARRASVRRATP